MFVAEKIIKHLTDKPGLTVWELFDEIETDYCTINAICLKMYRRGKLTREKKESNKAYSYYIKEFSNETRIN